jgi:hypothetical protein
MGQNRIQKRRNSLKTLGILQERAQTTLLIHYSCESFYTTQNGRTSRITSIAIRNLAAGQTESFSIHKIAEQHQISLDKISEHYDQLERQMLDDFFGFVRTHPGYNYVHWNMRDINYGFAALEHRYKVLKGKPVKIEDEHKFDLARLLVDIYGRTYIGHPRLKNIIEKNQITNLDFLSGEEEAKAFEQQEFIKLHRSTLRKVDCLASIFERTVDGKLKTDASFRDIYGLQPEQIGELVREHWFFVLLTFFVGVAGLIVGVWALL